MAAAQANEEAPDGSLAIWRQLLANRGTPQTGSLRVTPEMLLSG